MSAKQRLKALREFLKLRGYGRGYRYSAIPVYVDDPVYGLCENAGMLREQWSTVEIAANAVDGEMWFIDVWAIFGHCEGSVIDGLTFTFPEGSQ